MLGVGALLALAGISAASSIGSSLVNAHLTKKTNEQQIELMREQNRYNSAEAQINRDFSADQAQLQRDWEESMANTAYQRQVSQMEEAGINPILAASVGGAGTPMGAYATAEAAHSAQTAQLKAPQIDNAFNSALKAVMLGALISSPAKFKVGFGN